MLAERYAASLTTSVGRLVCSTAGLHEGPFLSSALNKTELAIRSSQVVQFCEVQSRRCEWASVLHVSGCGRKKELRQNVLHRLTRSVALPMLTFQLTKRRADLSTIAGALVIDVNCIWHVLTECFHCVPTSCNFSVFFTFHPKKCPVRRPVRYTPIPTPDGK